jgi:hypothetical protein
MAKELSLKAKLNELIPKWRKEATELAKTYGMRL